MQGNSATLLAGNRCHLEHNSFPLCENELGKKIECSSTPIPKKKRGKYSKYYQVLAELADGGVLTVYRRTVVCDGVIGCGMLW